MSLRIMIAVVVVASWVLPLAANDVVVGDIPSGGEFSHVASGSTTILDLTHPATADGVLTDATVRWYTQSSGACANEFKLRFFHPISLTSYTLIAERGPFSSSSSQLIPLSLSPGVSVQRGDVMAIVIAGPQSCGGVEGTYGSQSDLAVIINSDFTGGTVSTTSLERGVRYAFRASSASRVLVGIVPVVGFAQGGFGSLFRTDFQVTNSGDRSLGNLSFAFHPQGQSAASSDPSTGLNLPPNATYSGDLLATLGATGVGSLDVMTSGEYAPQVVAHVYNDGGAAGTSGFLEPMIAVRDALQPGEVAVIAFPADPTNFRMNIGVRTLDAGAKLSFHVYDAAGNTVTTGSTTYAASFFQQVTASQFIGGTAVPPGGQVALQVATGPAIVYSSSTDNRTNDSAINILSRRP